MEYGHYFYSKYAPQTDTVFVVLLLLVVFSIFGPVAQRSKYQHACTFLITAAVKGWGLQQGGTKEVCMCSGWVDGAVGAREGGRHAGRHHRLIISDLCLAPMHRPPPRLKRNRRWRSGGGRWSKCAPRRVCSNFHAHYAMSA